MNKSLRSMKTVRIVVESQYPYSHQELMAVKIVRQKEMYNHGT